MRDLIILGAGGAGWDIVSLVNAINKVCLQWNIIGFLDDNEALHDKEIMGVKVLGGIDIAIQFPHAEFVSSVANPNNRIIRRRIWDRVKTKGLKFATLIHPSTILYDGVTIEEGTVVNANCVLGTCVHLCKDVHLGYNCVIAHESIVKDHTSMGSSVSLSSGVIIEEDCYIGAGVTTTHNVTVEADTLVSIGAAVVKNLKNCTSRMWIGVPAIKADVYAYNQYKLKKL